MPNDNDETPMTDDQLFDAFLDVRRLLLHANESLRNIPDEPTRFVLGHLLMATEKLSQITLQLVVPPEA
jgi:hypothetical protein